MPHLVTDQEKVILINPDATTYANDEGALLPANVMRTSAFTTLLEERVGKSIANFLESDAALVAENTTSFAAPLEDTHSNIHESLTGAFKVKNINTDFLINRPDTFEILQKWEGIVLDVSQETFQARLTPLQGNTTEKYAEIYVDKVDPSDRPLLKIGATFYWSIGLLKSKSGTTRKKSILRFRRLPILTVAERSRAIAVAQEWEALFSDED